MISEWDQVVQRSAPRARSIKIVIFNPTRKQGIRGINREFLQKGIPVARTPQIADGMKETFSALGKMPASIGGRAI
jgi:hypothetical protein